MTKKTAVKKTAKKAVKKIIKKDYLPAGTSRASVNLRDELKTPFQKVCNASFMNFSGRVNYLIEQDIKNNLKTNDKQNGN